MAIHIEITRKAFRLDIDLGETEVDKENVNAVANGALSFMESRACQDDELTDGVSLASQLHQTADTIERNDVGWKVGKDYARWGDELFKDPTRREQLLEILQPIINGAIQHGVGLLEQALVAILCDKYGIVSKIRIERIASLFMLCWNLFKTAVISYSVKIAFNVLGKIIKRVILFLQERGFFEKLREIGGWASLHSLAMSYRPATDVIKYGAVATAGIIVGGVIVYCYINWKS